MHKGRGSLFVKLLLIYGLTFLAIVGTIFGVLKYKYKDRAFFMKSLSGYTDYVIRDIGNPPDLVRAKQLVDELRFQLRIIGPELDWSSSEDMSDIRVRKILRRKRFGGRRFKFLVRESENYKYIFAAPDHNDLSGLQLAALISIILLIIVFSYQLVKRAFRPLLDFQYMIDSVSKGDYSYRLKEDYGYEFRNLALAMNNMAGKIESNISSLKTLLIAVSHELRSPLTRMKLSLEFINNERIKKSMDEEIELLDQITGSLLEGEKLRSGYDVLDKKSFSMKGMIEEVLSIYKKNYSNILFLEIDDEVVQIDRARFILALRNVLENAVKYSPKEEIMVKTSLDDNYFSISISDKGPGVSEEHLSRLGEPFFRPDSSRTRESGGNGMGLYIAKSIVDAHGGKLTFSNNLNGGFTAVMSFLRS